MKTYEILNKSLDFFNILDFYFMECVDTKNIILYIMVKDSFHQETFHVKNDDVVFTDRYPLQTYCGNLYEAMMSNLSIFNGNNGKLLDWVSFMKNINSKGELLLKLQLMGCKI